MVLLNNAIDLLKVSCHDLIDFFREDRIHRQRDTGSRRKRADCFDGPGCEVGARRLWDSGRNSERAFQIPLKKPAFQVPGLSEALQDPVPDGDDPFRVPDGVVPVRCPENGGKRC